MKYRDLAKEAEFFERLALYGDRDTFLRAIAQDAGGGSRVSLSPEFNEIENNSMPMPNPLPPPPPPPLDAAAPAPSAPKKTAPQMPAFDKPTITTLQIFLNQFLRPQIIAGKASPIRQDGLLGPETIGVLKQWGKYNGLNTNDLADLIQTATKK